MLLADLKPLSVENMIGFATFSKIKVSIYK